MTYGQIGRRQRPTMTQFPKHQSALCARRRHRLHPAFRNHKLTVMPLTIELCASEEQTAFNLHRWAEIQADPELRRLPHRIETDRHGRILMSPPPAPAHGNRQSRTAALLIDLLAEGQVVTECPLSTSDGVKAIDVAWLAPGREAEVESSICLMRAPEVCVEIISPSNTGAEIDEKVALYFEAGAREVWLCGLDGKLTFHIGSAGNCRASWTLCPQFPTAVPRADPTRSPGCRTSCQQSQ